MADKFASRGYIKSNSSVAISPEDLEYVQSQVDERNMAKRDRDFGTADDIREHLTEKFDVTIDDKLKLWSVGGYFEEMPEGRNSAPRGVYTRRGGGDLSDEDVTKVQEMLTERYHAKRDRNFDLADEMRDTLMHTFNVRIDDRSNEWRVETDEYAMAGRNNLSADEIEEIESKLKERHSFKRDRFYDEADEIRDGLNEQFGVLIDDRTKEWRVDEFNVVEARVDESNEEDELDQAMDAVFNGSSDDVEEEEDVAAIEVEEDEKESSTSSSMTEEELSRLTVPDLKEKLREASLPVSGKKAELIARLLA